MIVGCAGRTNLTDNRKYFTDGSAGNTYPNNLDCEWWITPTTPVGEINLYFSEFEVAEGDYVTIWSACVVAAAATFHSFHSSFTSSPANRWRVYSVGGVKDQQLARYSGYSIPSAPPPIIYYFNHNTNNYLCVQTRSGTRVTSWWWSASMTGNRPPEAAEASIDPC